MHDLRRLRAFHAVADHRSFSAAALSLGYAQSVVSHHVAALEQEVGLTLVDRGTRPVRLTEAGERLREHAATLLGQVAAAEDELRALAGLEAGALRVGAFLTACTGFVPGALGSFEDAHPGVEVRVEQVEPQEALLRLRAGELDVAVVWRMYDPRGNGAPFDPAVESAHLADDPYRIVLSARHRLARRRNLSLADLAGERFNAPVTDPANPYRAWLERVCADAGFVPDVTHEVTDVTVARAFVSAGLSVGLMPELSIPFPRPDLAVRPLDGVHPFRSVYAAWLKGRRVPAVAPMVRMLSEAARARLAP